MAVILGVVLAATVFLAAPTAQQFVFTSYWFNGLLVALVVNTAFCFFSKLNRRTWDIAFTGLVIFHLSFVTLFLGVAYDKLFYFFGTVRLTEGETLNLADPASYDDSAWGRFFVPQTMLKGALTLDKVIPYHVVDGEKKGVANELTFGEGAHAVKGIVYTTRHIAYNGFRFFRSKEGYAPLIVLYDSRKNSLYGAYVPLQSLRKKDDSVYFTTGTQQGPGTLDYPAEPEQPLFELLARYYPDQKEERAGHMQFTIFPLHAGRETAPAKKLAEAKVEMGKKIRVGDHFLAMNEVRHWASLEMLYNPGRYIIMLSFWAGIGGLALTVLTRLFKVNKRSLGE
jgi:hypothetical protein